MAATLNGRYWDYRITRETLPDGSHLYALREVYYVDNKPEAWSLEPDRFVGDSAESVTASLTMALRNATEQGVLDLDTRETIPS